MLLNDYLKPYLDYYGKANLLSMGTIYKKNTGVVKEDNYLMPPSYRYKLEELKSQNIDHFVLFISQYDKRGFQVIKEELINEFQYCNSLLNNNELVTIKGIGSIQLFQNTPTLFEEENPNKAFGYPIFEI